MDFSLNDDQRMLKDTVDRLVARDYGFEQRKAYAKSPEGWSRAVWARMAEIGLLALPFPSAHGGLDGGPIETMLVMESLGRAMRARAAVVDDGDRRRGTEDGAAPRSSNAGSARSPLAS